MKDIFNNLYEPTLRTMTKESNKRESRRKEQKRKREVMITDDFKVKSESSIQWEIWEVELLVHLEMIGGANGIALSYVIRQNYVLYHSNQLTWDEKSRLAAPNTGNKYKLETLAVHNIITRNISKTSHAYTYIKANIKKKNGRIDTKALQARYHNLAMQDMYINEAKKTLETLSYRNDRAMKFKVFNSKFQNKVNILDSYGCTVHKKDVVDLLWTELNNAELTMFVALTKVYYCSNCQIYTKILQEIATQISTSKTTQFTTAGVSDLKKGGNNNRNISACPV